MNEEFVSPVPVSGKIKTATLTLIDQARERFGVTASALVRMALEDYVPRYLAGQGKPQHAELFAKLADALDAKPELEAELHQIARKGVRRRRAA